jgi:hypothetical protein
MPTNFREMEIPQYETWSRSALEAQVRDLRADFGQYLDHILGKRRTTALEMRAAKFFAEQYCNVVDTQGPFSLCNVHEFTLRVGPLPEAIALDAPPYIVQCGETTSTACGLGSERPSTVNWGPATPGASA